MSSVRFDVISIGTLSRNRLWNEAEAVRTPHSTTILIRTDNQKILVDPGLPAQIIAARLNERAGIGPDEIDTVFLTNFLPDHRGGLPAFAGARVLIHEREQESARQQLSRLLQDAPEDDTDRKYLQQEIKLLETFSNPEDQLAPGIDLFPLFGFTPGNCGLLLALPMTTVLITGDAVASREHFLAGQVLPESVDLEAAKESLRETYEIADVIIPARDNLFLNPRSLGI